jgi:enoyl-CoA hydratase/carnithine racemase
MAGVIYERRGDLAEIRLNRPDRLNALSIEVLSALNSYIEDAESEKGLRVVVLTGAGDRVFSAGTDISELVGLDEASAYQVAVRGQQLCNRIERCAVPVIAAVNGIAAGGGCELALACHLRVASTNAMFSLPETKLSLIPGYGGTQRLAREVGRGRALEFMLTGRSIGAEEALRIGIVNRLSEPAGLMSEAKSLTEEIARLAPLAVRACLQAVVGGLRLSLDEGLALEAELFAQLFASGDTKEGTRAFLEKRTPRFIGT